MSRWRQNQSYSELVKIHRAIADAKEAVDAERAMEVRVARENVRLLCGSHGLFMASMAVRSTPLAATDAEFEKMTQRMRAGGYHRAREAAGGMLDGSPDV